MHVLELVLVALSAAAAALWVAVSAYVLTVQQWRARARATLSTAMASLDADAASGLPSEDRLARLVPLLDAASREMVMHAVTSPDTNAEASAGLTAYLIDRWGLPPLEQDAAAHQTPRDKWRRMKALQILNGLGHACTFELLAAAVSEPDREVAGTALSILGGSKDPRAADVLIDGLRQHVHAASRVAVYLDRSPQHLGERLRALLTDTDPTVRRWSATLLGRYPDLEHIERDLSPLTEDNDPGVRKASVESLSHVGDRLAAAAALRLLADPVPYVRAASARALARLDRVDLADNVAKLLGDRDWWVRFAAKQSLESMGSEIWPVLARCLNHDDRFVRNGAAEVFQNLGVLDSFIVMEAATDEPNSEKIAMLRRVAAAGGLRLTDSLLERAGASVGPRVRQLLQSIGLERVGAA